MGTDFVDCEPQKVITFVTHTPYSFVYVFPMHASSSHVVYSYGVGSTSAAAWT